MPAPAPRLAPVTTATGLLSDMYSPVPLLGDLRRLLRFGDRPRETLFVADPLQLFAAAVAAHKVMPFCSALIWMACSGRGRAASSSSNDSDAIIAHRVWPRQRAPSTRTFIDVPSRMTVRR